MKFNASNRKILESLDDESKAQENEEQIEEIARQIEAHGGKVLEKTRFNVVAEMAEHRLHRLFNFVIDETQEFFGYVDSKLQDLQDYINHIEIGKDDHDKDDEEDKDDDDDDSYF